MPAFQLSLHQSVGDLKEDFLHRALHLSSLTASLETGTRLRSGGRGDDHQDALPRAPRRRWRRAPALPEPQPLSSGVGRALRLNPTSFRVQGGAPPRETPVPFAAAGSWRLATQRGREERPGPGWRGRRDRAPPWAPRLRRTGPGC